MASTLKVAIAVIALGLASGTAQAQRVYKHVDEKGNITYSQTPPANDAKTVRVPPPRGAYPNDRSLLEEERRTERQAAMDERRRELERRQQEQQEAMQDARRKQVEALRAECVRNRGTDCNDPSTIARMESERGPSQYRPRAR